MIRGRHLKNVKLICLIHMAQIHKLQGTAQVVFFVLLSGNQLRNNVLQKSSLFGFPQAECRICDDVLSLTHYFANVAFRLVFA